MGKWSGRNPIFQPLLLTNSSYNVALFQGTEMAALFVLFLEPLEENTTQQPSLYLSVTHMYVQNGTRQSVLNMIIPRCPLWSAVTHKSSGIGSETSSNCKVGAWFVWFDVFLNWNMFYYCGIKHKVILLWLKSSSWPFCSLERTVTAQRWQQLQAWL